MNILDLPLDKQKSLAAAENMALPEWQIEQRRYLKASDEAIKELDAYSGIVEEGWTQAERERFQAKIDSTHRD